MYRLLLLVLLTLAKLSCCGGTSASQDRQKPLRTDQALLDHARQVLLSEKSSACETQVSMISDAKKLLFILLGKRSSN